MQQIDTFGERLAKIRENKGLSRQMAADDLGISRASLEYYEKGKRKPDSEIITALVRYYNVSADWLLGLSKTQTPDTDLQAICSYTGLSDKAVKNITEMKSTHAAEYYSATDILNTLIEAGAIAKICTIVSEHLNKIEAADESIDELSAQIESVEAAIAKLDSVYEPTEPGESALISEKESDKETLEIVLTALAELKDHSADHTRRFLSHEMFDILKEEVDGIIDDLIP